MLVSMAVFTETAEDQCPKIAKIFFFFFGGGGGGGGGGVGGKVGINLLLSPLVWVLKNSRYT